MLRNDTANNTLPAIGLLLPQEDKTARQDSTRTQLKTLKECHPCHASRLPIYIFTFNRESPSAVRGPVARTSKSQHVPGRRTKTASPSCIGALHIASLGLPCWLGALLRKEREGRQGSERDGGHVVWNARCHILIYEAWRGMANVGAGRFVLLQEGLTAVFTSLPALCDQSAWRHHVRAGTRRGGISSSLQFCGIGLCSGAAQVWAGPNP